MEDWTGNGQQRAASFGPALFRDPGGTWSYTTRAAFTYDSWWAECQADPGCLSRRDGLWVYGTGASAITGLPGFMLITGSVRLPCSTSVDNYVPSEPGRSRWPAPDIRGFLPLALEIVIYA